MSEERWQSTDDFVAACKAFNALTEAKRKLYNIEFYFTINDVNTIQDILIELGYSIQKINNGKQTNT